MKIVEVTWADAVIENAGLEPAAAAEALIPLVRHNVGYLVKQGQNLYDLPRMFVAILVLMAIATAIYASLTLLERVLLSWPR